MRWPTRDGIRTGALGTIMGRQTVATSLRGGARERSGGTAVTLAIAALFLGFAAGISLLAPINVLTLRREGDAQVRATVTRRLLLVFPINATTIDDVRAVSRTTRIPETGPREEQRVDPTRPEHEGFLVLRRGDHSSVEVSTSPAQLDDVERRVRQFLEGPDASLQVWLVSNWKVAVLLTAVVGFPGVLLLLATAWDLVGNLRR